MHVVLATFGTDGDVFPYLGLGRHLVSRGHKVSLVTSAYYQSAARENGFDFSELNTREETDEVLGNPDFWHPLKGGLVAARWGVRFLPRQYDLLRRLVSTPQTVVVANPGVLAARLLHDHLHTPLASIVLQPWLIPSACKPPVMTGGLTLPRRTPLWLGKLYCWALNRVGDFLLGRDLNHFRRTLDLPKIRNVFNWWLSPQLILALFPEWFGAPQPDWPRAICQLGFPLYDGRAAARIEDSLEAFLRAGEPPIAITFGTGIRHAGKLYHEAVQACARLGRRGIVITKYPAQIPALLPSDFHTVSYAPFLQLFPRCAGVLHHGGIGTLAAALVSGVPQLIVPISFDQLDNSLRLKALRHGSYVRLRDASSEKLATALEKAIGAFVPPSASQSNMPDVLIRAAEQIEGCLTMNGTHQR